MLREELIKAIAVPPPLRVGKRLASILNTPAPELKPCANPDCFNFHNNKKYCSRYCVGKVHYRIRQAKGSRASGDKRRGINTNAHIRVRINGKLAYAHRVLVENELHTGQRGFGNYFCCLPEDSVIHYRDLNKHHNCYASQLCESCTLRFFLFINSSGIIFQYLARYGFSNLEVLTGDAAREHIRIHQTQMQQAKKAKRK